MSCQRSALCLRRHRPLVTVSALPGKCLELDCLDKTGEGLTAPGSRRSSAGQNAASEGVLARSATPVPALLTSNRHLTEEALLNQGGSVTPSSILWRHWSPVPHGRVLKEKEGRAVSKTGVPNWDTGSREGNDQKDRRGYGTGSENASDIWLKPSEK